MAVAAVDPYRENLLQQARILSELRRRKARERLIPYVQHTFPGYLAADHLSEIAEHLEAVERGEIDRLMIIEPPRHGKSLLTSQRFPLWYLGRNPSAEVIHASYGGDLVTDFGRNLRNLTYNPAHLDVFPTLQLAADSKASNRWHTRQGGIYVAAGVGGPITGRGGNLILIDDPVKNREEADSETIREKTWDWYTNDLYSRRLPGCAIILIQTRWHEDDLAGRLLDAQGSGGDQWHVLHHPAISPKGEALWPERYPLPDLERIRRVSGARAWNSLFQGDPTPDDGTYFSKDWLHNWPSKPERQHLKVYGASDWAVTHDAGDYTVHVVGGVDPQGDLYVLDMWREQRNTLDSTEAHLNMIERWEPLRWADEKAQVENSVWPFVRQMRKEREIVHGTPVHLSAQGDKEVKAQSIRGRMEQGRVFFPHHAAWWPEMKNEILKFPTGKNDDIVDALGMLGRMLHGMIKGTIPDEAESKVPFIGVGDTSDELPELGSRGVA